MELLKYVRFYLGMSLLSQIDGTTRPEARYGLPPPPGGIL